MADGRHEPVSIHDRVGGEDTALRLAMAAGPAPSGHELADPAAPAGASATRCPYCGGAALTRFGRTPRGDQRWHCRGCGRKHQATTRTVLAGLHQPAKFQALVADMLGPNPASCRELARALAIDKSTAWRWRQRASRSFAAASRPAPVEPLAMAGTILRESRKASREWVNHRRDPATHPTPGRLRWVDYRRQGLAPPDHLPRYRIPVAIAIDLAGRVTAEAEHATAPPAEPPSAGQPPGATAEEAAAIRLALRPPHCLAPHLPSATPALAAATRLTAAFRSFIEPFRGPATRHLPAYAAWFVARADRRMH